jgi:muramoyltetrapeptide carboxypeptidase
MQQGIATLESWGLKVRLSPHLYGAHHQLSGTDTDRASDLQQLIDDRNIRAIFFARGGYGTARLLPHLRLAPLLANPKWVVGYSDATALHLALYRLGLQSLHAAMPHRFADTASVESLRAALFGELSNLQVFKSPNQANLLGEAQGRLVGGNLSVLYSLQSTPYALQPAGTILFVEDLSEQLYHLDRMMLNLALSNTLCQLRALILGHFTDMKDGTTPYGLSPYAIIREHVAPYNIPLACAFPAGHQPPNLALQLGAEVRLVVEKDVSRIAPLHLAR